MDHEYFTLIIMVTTALRVPIQNKISLTSQSNKPIDIPIVWQDNVWYLYREHLIHKTFYTLAVHQSGVHRMAWVILVREEAGYMTLYWIEIIII